MRTEPEPRSTAQPIAYRGEAEEAVEIHPLAECHYIQRSNCVMLLQLLILRSHLTERLSRSCVSLNSVCNEMLNRALDEEIPGTITISIPVGRFLSQFPLSLFDLPALFMKQPVPVCT